MTQPSLFDPRPPTRALSRRHDHDSSYAAAAELERSGTRARHEALILEALLGELALTAAEIGARVELEHVQVARRLAAMAKRRLIQRIAQPGERLRWRLTR